MKKTLIYTADRYRFLSLQDLREFSYDAEALNFSEYALPKLVTELAPGPDKGRVKKITVERQRY